MIVAVLLAVLPGFGAQTYPGVGLVLRVSPERSEVLLSVQEIPGHMDARVISLPVHDACDWQGLRPGMMVDFTFVETGKSPYADNLRVRRFVSLENDPQSATRLAIIQAAMDPARPAALAVGQKVPDFSLTDQNKQPVALSQFSGKIVAITFVYTRCPLPNFCFRLSNNFGQLQKRFGRQMGRDLILLTVTLDPANDQPGTLAAYASIWKANGASWHFLTGPAPAIRNVTGLFGVVYNPDEGMLTHSLHTAIVDRQGVLAANLEGNEFTGKQLGDLVEDLLNRE